MSHKTKICNVALATHIETCFQNFTYAPLVINGYWFEVEHHEKEKRGLKSVIEHNISQITSKFYEESSCSNKKKADEIAKTFVQNGKSSLKDLQGNIDVELEVEIYEKIKNKSRDVLEVKTLKEIDKIIQNSDMVLDLNSPLESLKSLEKRVYDHAIEALQVKAGFKPISLASYPLKQLGMFFTEEVCFRPEGLTYSPCGEEKVLLPNEIITETNVLKESISSEATEIQNVTNFQGSTITTKDSLKLINSYERTVRKETDIKTKTKASVKGKIFKIIDLDVSGEISTSFNQIMEAVSKSSSEINRSLVNEAVRNLTIETSQKTITTSELSQTTTNTREFKNTTDEPIGYIVRDSYCVNSVIHKRTNVQLAWSGCIENPGKELCRPDNIREVLSEDIKQIIDKWSVAAAPEAFGSRPGNETICTATSTLDRWGFPFGDNVEFEGNINGTIPPNSTYIGNSAEITIVESDTAVVSQQVTTQPMNGASGQIQFSAKILVDNKFANKEWVRYKICFQVSSPEASAYDSNLELWRNDQAEIEIEALLEKEKEKLSEFLLSDKVAAAIEQRIFKDFFALNTIDDCCELISHVRTIFDFEKLCYSLQPSWNANGSGCQTSDPVSIYTAQCLNFYLPVKEGKEAQAITTLLAIKEIPSSSSILQQVAGYITQIQDLRNTVFNRSFDTTGWDEKIDAPNKYNLTPYDTSNNEWDADFETKLNFQIIDIHTVTVPTGGVKVDIRPPLC